MKIDKILSLFLIVGSTLISVSCISAQNENVLNGPKPLPGGKIGSAKDYFIELVFQSNDTSHVYLFDKNAKPVSPIAITGRIVFQQYDSTISSFDLIHARAGGFYALTAIPVYKICDIFFEIKGGPVTVQFNADEGIVSKPPAGH